MPTVARTTFPGLSAELLARVAKGDQAAFRLFYDQSSRLLFALARRMLGSRDEATALLHELYLDIWRKSIRYDAARATPITWLVTLARNRAVDRLQARDGQPKSAPSNSPQMVGSVTERHPTGRESQMELDRRHAVTSALSSLPEIQRQMVEWAFFDGLSHQDIAARTGLSTNVVDDHLRTAMNQLKDALLPYLDEPSRT